MLQAFVLGFTLLLSSIAFSAPRHLTCANGTIETAGDSLFEMDIYSDKIVFMPYEGGITVEAKDIVPLNQVLYVKNLQTVYSVEGTEENVELDAQVKVTPGAKAALVSLRFNNGTWAHYKLRCKFARN